MLPFFTLGYAIASIQGDKLDGYSPPFQKAISLAGLFYLLFGLVFLKLFLSLYNIKNSIIAFVLVIIVFGTNLLTYTVMLPSMSHVYSWGFITAFLYFIKRLFISQKIKYLYFGIFIFGIILLPIFFPVPAKWS